MEDKGTGTSLIQDLQYRHRIGAIARKPEGDKETRLSTASLIIESGKVARQANGAVTVSVGGTVVLVTACMAKKPREGIDFFPLTVEYQERHRPVSSPSDCPLMLRRASKSQERVMASS